MYSTLIEQWAKDQGFDTWASDHATVLRNMAKWMDKNNPHPEAREEDYEIGTPREFAKRLAWMTINGKPDLDQWENHIRTRDAALSRLAAPKPEGQANHPGTPDSSIRNCDSCIHWDDAQGCRAGVWIQCATGKNTAITGDYWLPKPTSPAPEATCKKSLQVEPAPFPAIFDSDRAEAMLGPKNFSIYGKQEPAPAPSEEEWSAIKRILNETDCTDGQFLAIKGHVDSLRSQLARKDEGREV